MTIEEKLQAMEALWVDITRNEELFESPAWHAQVLRHRDEILIAGEESFIDCVANHLLNSRILILWNDHVSEFGALRLQRLRN